MRIITHYLLVAILTLGLLTFGLPCLAFAEILKETKPIEVIYQQQLRLDVASDGVNRINFDNFRVVKLIGNISSFTSVLLDQGSDLFIAPKLPPGKKIDFSALLATGDIIDFSLNIVKSEVPYLVKLKFPSNVTGADTAGAAKSEAAKMIEAMHSGKTGKYYIQKSTKKINMPLTFQTKAVAQNSYRFGNLHGTSLILENTSRSRSLKITANELVRSFEGIVAIYIEQGLLSPRGKTKAYIVFKELEA
jgi:hypothetical protein